MSLLNKSFTPVHALAFSLLFQSTIRMIIPQLSSFISDGVVLILCEAMVGIVSFALPAIVFFRIVGLSPGSMISLKLTFPPHPFFSGCAVITAVAAAGYISERIALLFELYRPALRLKDKITDGGPLSYYIILFMATVPLAALTEEIFYRGIVLNSLAGYNRFFALIFQSLLFGLLHEDPGQFLYTVCGGFLLGIMTLECNSVIFAVITHMSNNALTFAYLYVGNNPILTAVTVLLFASGFVGFVLLLRRIMKRPVQVYSCSFNKLTRYFMISPPMITYTIIKIILFLNSIG